MLESTGDIVGDIASWAIKLSAIVAAGVSIWNTVKIKEVHKLTNSLATRTEALARKTGLAEGNLIGREEQTAERKEERDNP